MTVRTLLVVLAILQLSACGGATTPTREIQSGYAIYDVKPGEGVGHKQIIDAVVTAIKKNSSEARIINNIPPSPLPDMPGKYEITNPFEGSRLEALAGQSLGIPKCNDSLVVIHTEKNTMRKYNVLCLRTPV